MAKQAQKYHLAMAGEYYVAAQLQRLGISGSLTYGNAKRADILAFSQQTGRGEFIEVKTSNIGRWPIGNRVPEPSNQIWVFVNMPYKITEHPEFYILTQSQLHTVLKPEEDAYMEKYFRKHGVPYGDKAGVTSAKKDLIEQYKDNWEALTSKIAASHS